MSRIRGKNTKPELRVRSALHAAGFRYRLHTRQLPGRPDLCLRKYKAVVFINGCFWHHHDCELFRLPKTRQDFWLSKLESNRNRDYHNWHELILAGWRLAVVWECAFRGKFSIGEQKTLEILQTWLSDSPLNYLHIRNQEDGRHQSLGLAE